MIRRILPILAIAALAGLLGPQLFIDLTAPTTPAAKAPTSANVAPAEPVPAIPATETREDATLSVAVPLIARWEGLRRKAYADLVGVWTICYGHTRDVQPGDSMTEDECTALLRADVAEYRLGLHRYFIEETILDRLPPERDAAFTSLAFNVGIAGAGKSTATRRLNAGDIHGACEALTWWNKAGGRVIRGLVNRRAEEQALCLKGA